MAKSLLYHETHSDHHESILERNHLLLFQCQHAINCEMELSAPQVIAYLMGWGDQICSHHYVPLFWSILQSKVTMTLHELQLNDNQYVFFLNKHIEGFRMFKQIGHWQCRTKQ